MITDVYKYFGMKAMRLDAISPYMKYGSNKTAIEMFHHLKYCRAEHIVSSHHNHMAKSRVHVARILLCIVFACACVAI